VLHSSVFYPTEYGFIPQTRSEDGDHLDVMVLVSQPTFPGCVLEARPVGVLDMVDEAGEDRKVIAVAEHDPTYQDVRAIGDLGEHFKKEVQQFFESYKALEEGKWTMVRGWLDRDEAHRLIMEAHARCLGEAGADAGGGVAGRHRPRVRGE
jgi:inorganic pyrophosphatase